MRIGIGIKNTTTGEIDLNVVIPFLKPENLVLRRNADKQGSRPDWHAFIGYDRCGALWKRTSNTGTTFLSGNLESPLFPGGKIDVALFAADQDRPGEYDLTWRPREGAAATTASAGSGSSTGTAASADEDDGIPF